MNKILLACGVLLLCSSVQAQKVTFKNTPQNTALEGRTVWRGYVSFGFETSEFRPCGSREKWWVLSTKDLSQRYAKLSPKMYGTVYVRLKGMPTHKGTYGHLGVYQRQFAVQSVLEARAPRSDDCKVKSS
jgi:hypothetical protein